MTSMISAVCNQVCMQKQFQKAIHRESEREKDGGRRHWEEKLLYINTADSMQQAALKVAEEKF